MCVLLCVCFCLPGHKKISLKYDVKVSAQRTLFSLVWTIDELSRLNVQGQEMRVETQRLQDLLNDENCDLVQQNILNKLERLSLYF